MHPRRYKNTATAVVIFLCIDLIVTGLSPYIYERYVCVIFAILQIIAILLVVATLYSLVSGTQSFRVGLFSSVFKFTRPTLIVTLIYTGLVLGSTSYRVYAVFTDISAVNLWSDWIYILLFILLLLIAPAYGTAVLWLTQQLAGADLYHQQPKKHNKQELVL
eukprot:gb/GECH01010180.1/.p1 GENE.gb/GECH01010180.1/~~gb/GECH01010180.1/.p1  ORF type:complete len:162 (+),score=13.14 gb/GECH01010180.1/:1-486(+)